MFHHTGCDQKALQMKDFKLKLLGYSANTHKTLYDFT